MQYNLSHKLYCIISKSYSIQNDVHMHNKERFKHFLSRSPPAVEFS